MRAVLAACALLVAGTVVAEAQPYYGGPPPPPPPGEGFGFGYGYRRPPPPPPPYGGYGYGYRRRCYIVEGYYGPRRVCRGPY